MPKLIDVDKLLAWLGTHVKQIEDKPYNDLTINRAIAFEDVQMAIDSGTFDPTPVQPDIKPGDKVNHKTYGIGTVMGHSDRRYVNVQFLDFYTECWTEGLKVISDGD